MRSARGAGLTPRRVSPRRSRLRHLDRAQVVAGPARRGRCRDEGTQTRPDDLWELGRPRPRTESQPAGPDRHSRPARDRPRRECHPQEERSGDRGTGRSQRLPSPSRWDEGSALIGPPRRNDRRLFGLTFERLRRRRDSTTRGHGPLPIHECPCEIEVAVHENRDRVCHAADAASCWRRYVCAAPSGAAR